jgi:uncharacterized membrane protein YccC
MTQLTEMFALNKKGFNLRRGAVLGVVLAPLIIVGVFPHEQKYFLSVIFGALFVALTDPGGKLSYRLPRHAVVAVAGALLTALGFSLGADAWGFVVLAVFVATLLGGLAAKYGKHRFVAAYLLNVWFIITLGLGAVFHGGIHISPWPQAVAWLIGAALWVAYVIITWLASGRKEQPQPVAEIPGDVTPVKLTRPLVLFAIIRAVAVSIAVAISFGLKLPDAYWMPIAAIIAMKPSFQQSALTAAQRLAGTVIGAAVAALVLVAVDNKTALEVIVVVLFALAGMIRTVNYTWYTAAIAGAVLTAIDVPHPSSLTSEGRRILFTLAGVGIALIVLLLAGLLQKRSAKPTPAAPKYHSATST